MITSISSIYFYSNDLDKTFDFYKLLGFDVKKETGLVTFYVNWFRVDFVDQKHSDIKDPGMFTRVKVEDVDEFYNFVVKKGIKEVSKPKDMEWGTREFIVKDPDGYSWVFFSKAK